MGLKTYFIDIFHLLHQLKFLRNGVVRSNIRVGLEAARSATATPFSLICGRRAMDKQSKLKIRDYRDDDLKALLTLNEAVVEVTSEMDEAHCRELISYCYRCLVVTLELEVLGFAMAIREGEGYDNGNYRWFETRHEQFLYIDRIVLDERIRGYGIASKLYDRLISCVGFSKPWTLCAEMNIKPPNNHSLYFHANYGFVEIGRRTLPSGKEVSMQTKTYG